MRVGTKVGTRGQKERHRPAVRAGAWGCLSRASGASRANRDRSGLAAPELRLSGAARDRPFGGGRPGLDARRRILAWPRLARLRFLSRAFLYGLRPALARPLRLLSRQRTGGSKRQSRTEEQAICERK